ncbi:MAG: UDP-3-O-(3-hydroxymyristoyl)glucosamine N-acyltransferase [Phycisphaerae bacterium]
MDEMTLSELADHLGGTLEGNGDVTVTAMASLTDAGPGEVAFLANDKYIPQMAETKAAAVIVATDYDGPGDTLIRCDDPYFAFRNAMVAFHGFRQPEFEGIDDRASIHPTATLGEGVSIAPFVTVGPGARIGDGCVLYPGVYVGPNVIMGERCILHPNVTLYDETHLGDRVTVHAGSSIGHDGFGYATHQGAHHKIPQAGHVVVEDDCEFGACCAIDRSAMGETRIGTGTKFSDLVTIGHGTKMGNHCLVVAQTGIAGSTTIGNYCVFAGQVGVSGHIHIGDGVQAGAQAGIIGDTPAGQKVWGTPAIPFARSKRAYRCLARLPEMRKEIRLLRKQLDALEKQVGGAEEDQ